MKYGKMTEARTAQMLVMLAGLPQAVVDALAAEGRSDAEMAEALSAALGDRAHAVANLILGL